MGFERNLVRKTNLKGFRMAKSKLITPSSLEGETTIIGAEPKRVPEVVGVKPVGSQVLIEILTVQELANTIISIDQKTDLKVPLQGYVKAVGPNFKSAEWGFDVGNRVLISGSGVQAPNYDNCHRDRFFMEPHAVKSVLIEE
jgi:hypothetical protein